MCIRDRIVSDYRMDVFGGEYWIRFLERFFPNDKIIITSGFLRPEFSIPFEVMYKPFDFATLTAQIKATIDTVDFIPEAPDRLIGVWAYDELEYEKLVRLFDALRADSEQMVGGRVTVLQGPQWGPPPDSVMTVRYPEPRQ